MVAVEVGSFFKNTATGNQDVPISTDLTGAASGTWAIIFWTTGSESASGTFDTDGCEVCLGFTTGAADSQAVAYFAQHAVSTMVTSRRGAAKCITMPNAAGNGIDYEADFVSYPDSTHFRINWTTNNADLIRINYMIISGLTNAKVVDWAISSSTGVNYDVTTVGFQPDLVINAYSRIVGNPASHANAVFGMGVMNAAGEQWANAIVSLDALGTSNTSRWQRTDSCLLGVSTSETQQERANFVSMLSNGFRVLFSANGDAFGYRAKSLCLKGLSSKIGALTTPGATGTQVVASSHDFTIKGILSSSYRAGASTTPLTFAALQIGGSDMTNHRSSVMGDDDAAGVSIAQPATRTDRIWWVASAAAVYEDGTTSAHDTDSFDILWTTVGTSQIGYLLIGDAVSTNTELTVADATHGHAADNLALTQDHTLVVADGSHAHTADNIALTQANALIIAEALHAHTADNVTLTQAHVLAIADALHDHLADNLTLAVTDGLIIADATHAHSTDNLTLTQAHVLAIAEALHGHVVDNVTLTQAHTLAVAEALHGHLADNLVITTAVVVGTPGTVIVVTITPKVRLSTYAPTVELETYNPLVRISNE